MGQIPANYQPTLEIDWFLNTLLRNFCLFRPKNSDLSEKTETSTEKESLE